MIQTALWLPRQMHEQLKKEGGERGLGDEIRRRLQFSFDAEPPDKTTDMLLAAINQIAIELEEPWYANRFAFDVFKAAIIELLSKCQSNGQAEPEAIAKLQATYPDEKPETIGRILALVALHIFSDRPSKLSYVNKRKG